MSDPKCFTCEDQGYLVCGNCDKFEELVVVRREDLEWAQSYTPSHWSDGRPNEFYNRIQLVLGKELVGKWEPKP